MFEVAKPGCLQQNRERKCAETIGTVLVPWAGHFQRQNTNMFLQQNIRKQFLSNSTRKLMSFKITEMLIGLKIQLLRHLL